MESSTRAPFVYQFVLNGDHTHNYIADADIGDIDKSQTVWQHLDLTLPES